MEKKRGGRGGDIFLVNSTLIKRPYYTRFRVYSMQLLFSSTFSFFFCSYIRTYARRGRRSRKKREIRNGARSIRGKQCSAVVSLSLSLSSTHEYCKFQGFPRIEGRTGKWERLARTLKIRDTMEICIKYICMYICVYTGGSIYSRELGSFSRGEIV